MKNTEQGNVGVKKKGWTWLGTAGLALALAVSLSGCGAKDSTEASSSPTTSSVPSASAAATTAPSATTAPTTSTDAATVYPFTIKDSTGTELTLKEEPKRIVTLAPSETETVFAVGAGERVVGVDQYSNYPAEAADKTKVGDLNTNLEAVLALKPDLVIAHSGLQIDVINKLRELNVPVYADDPKTLDQVIEHIDKVGQLVNDVAGANTVTAKMKADRDQVIEAVKGAPAKKVYLEFSEGWTVGKGEFLDELLTLAGGTNVAGDKSGWFEINAESILQSKPDVILYGTDDYTGNTIYDAILKRPGFSSLDAVKNKQLFPIQSDLVSRVGPRLTDGLVEIAKAVHPDRVK
ncbi:ABC transporter substrate-binding protein [Gorillibacterium sp. CAU 1737]|uniref:ABC transporter substrate-binding protein n=1 Tax=Gorillibacterium sp. CAU 1737 TaxID=3140362 RepID=UPI0032612A32